MNAQHKVAVFLCFDVRLVNPESVLLYLTSGPSYDRTNNYDEYELACERNVALLCVDFCDPLVKGFHHV